MTDGTDRILSRRQALVGVSSTLALGAAAVYVTHSPNQADVEDYPTAFSAPDGPSAGLGIPLDDHPMMGTVDADNYLFAWSDYRCPHCKDFDENALLELAANEVADGRLAVVFLELPLLGDASRTAARVSKAVWRAVAIDDPDAWGRYHRYVYTKQDGSTPGWASRSNLLQYAAAVDGVPRDDIERRLRENRSSLQRAVTTDVAIAFDDLGLDRGVPLFALSNTNTGDWLSFSGSQPYENVQTALERLQDA